MKRLVCCVLFLAAAGMLPAGAQMPAVPLVTGPDLPAVGAPTQVAIFTNERFDGCAGKDVATRSIAVPNGAWDRAVLEFTGTPAGDPWDRLFSVSIAGVEVLRGTTPRTTFSIKRDITEYLSLLPAGTSVNVTVNFGTYVGAQLATVTLDLYADEPTAALVAKPWDTVVPVFNLGGLSGGQVLSKDGGVTFPAKAPSAATIDLTLSNHGSEEAQFANRIFHVFVDGVELATARPMPYTYAILGFGAANANSACSGPATSADGDLLHPVMWWTAQQALDIAGAHPGVGEIPPYRAQIIDATELSMLAGGPHQVEVRQQNGGALWITSLSFLLAK